MGSRTAFVCFYEAYPPDSGAGSVSYCTALYSSAESLLLQVCDRDETISMSAGLNVRSLNMPAKSKMDKVVGLRNRLDEIMKALSDYAPDTVVLEGASWVYYHLRLMKRIRKQLPDTRIIYHSHNVEYQLRKEKNGALITAATKLAEGKVLRGADACFAVSDVDAEQFYSLYGIRPLIFPNGVDVNRYDLVSNADQDAIREKYDIGPKALLFMGLYAYKPNTEAVDFLLREVMPAVVERDPEVQLVITGGNVPFSYPWLIRLGVLPYDEMPALVGGCSIGLAPIFSGSGTRLKILEYMAARLPVAATPKGAEGINVTDGKNILLAETGKEYADGIVRLLGDRSLCDSLANEAFELVKSEYDWSAVMPDAI